MSALRLAVPSKGRLMEQTAAYFAEAGLTIAKSGGDREYAARATGIDGIEVAYLQASEIPHALVTGTIHAGVTGEDLIREKLRDADAATTLVKSLGYGRADLVVAVPKSWIDVETMADLDDAAAAFRARHGFAMRVATKYLNLTRRFFRENGVAYYRLLESAGATEGTPATGAAEIVVDITSSGSTLRANHLKIVFDGTILRSQAQLRVSRAADWGGETLGALRVLIDRIEARAAAKKRVVLRAALRAQDQTGLTEALDAVGAALVSVDGPLVTVGARKEAAYAAARLLQQRGAARVDSSEPEMLYGAGAGEYERVAATLRA